MWHDVSVAGGGCVLTCDLCRVLYGVCIVLAGPASAVHVHVPVVTRVKVRSKE